MKLVARTIKHHEIHYDDEPPWSNLKKKQGDEMMCCHTLRIRNS